ncbi:MAG: hypothetical protein LBQ61_02520 [Spirochaetales bacterium]|jgi:hypothetical protein|nr:hypothetical protein [Spirochaetales bacterium]
MVKEELNKRTPLRVFEQSIHGGLGKGNIGALASRKGVGKTACLVHIAMDKLFRNEPVLHVSFSSRMDHIVSWYEDTFKEIAQKRSLEQAMEVHDEIIRSRIIMNFNQKGLPMTGILKSIETMIREGHFPARCMIVDGFDLSMSAPEDLDRLKQFAQALGLEVWMSLSLKGPDPVFTDQGFPRELESWQEKFDVLISLRHKGKDVELSVVKDHGRITVSPMNLLLDTKSLLIVEK